MAMFFPNEGLRQIIVNLVYYLPFYARLYKNDYTPVATTVIGDFTQADFTGYSGPAVINWTGGSTGTGYSNQTSSIITWTLTGGSPQTVYGYWSADSSNTALFWAERAPSPITLTTVGDSIKLTVTLSVNYP